MAKLFASEAAMEIALDAVRVHGPELRLLDRVRCRFRDAPLMIVGEGTNENARAQRHREPARRAGRGGAVTRSWPIEAARTLLFVPGSRPTTGSTRRSAVVRPGRHRPRGRIWDLQDGRWCGGHAQRRDGRGRRGGARQRNRLAAPRRGRHPGGLRQACARWWCRWPPGAAGGLAILAERLGPDVAVVALVETALGVHRAHDLRGRGRCATARLRTPQHLAADLGSAADDGQCSWRAGSCWSWPHASGPSCRRRRHDDHPRRPRRRCRPPGPRARLHRQAVRPPQVGPVTTAFRPTRAAWRIGYWSAPWRRAG